jgi:hypothetical protein
MNHPHISSIGRDPVDLTLFLACYNEAENIVGTLETVVETMAEIGRSYELIVIDDASRICPCVSSSSRSIGASLEISSPPPDWAEGPTTN